MSHTKEPWEVDHRECDCVRYFVVIGPDGKTIMDTMNSESQLIEEEFDEDGFRDQWDEQGRLDLNRAAQCVNACEGIADPTSVPELIAALRAFVDYYERHGGEGNLATPVMEYRVAKLVLAKVQRDDKTM